MNAAARAALQNRLLVLCYHGVCAEKADVPDAAGLHVPGELFEAQVRFILKKYNSVTLSQVSSHCLEGAPLPASPVLFTFDDGYRNVRINGLPILRSLQVPSVLFPVPGSTDAGHWLWPAVLEFRRGESPDYGVLRKRLGSVSASERRAWFKDNISEDSLPLCDYTLASWDELRAARDSGLVEIGSHGLTHEPLTTCDDSLLREELVDSRELLSRRLGVDAAAVAYPNGMYSPKVTAAAAESGYSIGFTTDPRHVRLDDSPLSLPRIQVGASDTVPVLAARLSGWTEWLRKT